MNINKDIEKTEAQYKARAKQVKVTLIYPNQDTPGGNWAGKVVSDISPLKSGTRWTTTLWLWFNGVMWRGTHIAGGFGYDKESNNMAHIIMNMYHYSFCEGSGDWYKEYRNFTDILGDKLDSDWKTAFRKKGYYIVDVL